MNESTCICLSKENKQTNKEFLVIDHGTDYSNQGQYAKGNFFDSISFSFILVLLV